MSEAPYSFTLVLRGRDLSATDLDHLREVGLDDASFGARGNEQVVLFDREAGTLANALLDAIWDLEAALPDHRVVRVEPDDLVTMARIAERTGRSRANVGQLVAGARGSGGFPPPVSRIGGASQIWRWSEVEEWLDHHRHDESAVSSGAHRFIGALNGVLESRRQFEALAKIAAAGSASVGLEFTKDTIEALPLMLEETVRTLSRQLTVT